MIEGNTRLTIRPRSPFLSLAVSSISSSHSACPMSNNLRQTARQDRLDEKMSISVYGCIYTIVEHDVSYFFSPSLSLSVRLWAYKTIIHSVGFPASLSQIGEGKQRRQLFDFPFLFRDAYIDICVE